VLAWPLSTWMILLLATFLVSATVCWLAIRYANRRQLIDQPGRRRSHVVATPRGGGIGIVVAVLAGLLATMVGDPGSVTGWPRREELALLSLGGGVLIVAAVGWLDDHRSLGAGIRLCAHVLAVVVSLLPILLIDVPSLSGNPVMPWVLAALAVACIAAVWSINLHNFMDGINGLLAFQALFVFVALGRSVRAPAMQSTPSALGCLRLPRSDSCRSISRAPASSWAMSAVAAWGCWSRQASAGRLPRCPI
jgi:UDP-N-acetylmuramyl pentapeptide phosphotransferase/UDP-N-acetylglucosamine-1-phosphate transferase